jgi:hypothetical protein
MSRYRLHRSAGEAMMGYLPRAADAATGVWRHADFPAHRPASRLLRRLLRQTVFTLVKLYAYVSSPALQGHTGKSCRTTDMAGGIAG